jgi:hypothetical protein
MRNICRSGHKRLKILFDGYLMEREPEDAGKNEKRCFIGVLTWFLADSYLMVI